MRRLPLLLGVLVGALVVLLVQQVGTGSSTGLRLALAAVALGVVSLALVRRRR